MPLLDDDCDDCVPSYLKQARQTSLSTGVLVSILPFIATFFLVAVIVSQKVLPRLVHPSELDEDSDSYASLLSPAGRAPGTNRRTMWNWSYYGKLSRHRLTEVACVTTMALSSVLVELILCEISNTLDPAARAIALKITLFLLVLQIIIIIPTLQIHSITTTIAGNYYHRDLAALHEKKITYKSAYVATLLTLVAWLSAFWYLPHTTLLAETLQQRTAASPQKTNTRLEACLERVGIIGISLMASLAGFAAVSSIWQTFGIRHRQIRDADLSRREAGLDATRNMLDMKRSRLRALQTQIEEQTPLSEKGIFTRMMGSISGSDAERELRALLIETQGLEMMCMSLESSVSNMRSIHATQQRSHSTLGRLTNMTSLVFSLYCLYRISATSLSSLRRWWQPTSDFATSDPINNILALLTTHYDPSLDRAAWARQISFALSGLILCLSFSAVLQTFRLFSRFAPAVVRHAQSTFPLLIAQVAGIYVISSCLLLRSSSLTSDEVSSVVTDALGLPLDPRFVEAWFESWFLVAVGLTATGILVFRKLGAKNRGDAAYDDDDDFDEDTWEEDVEMAKRH